MPLLLPKAQEFGAAPKMSGYQKVWNEEPYKKDEGFPSKGELDAPAAGGDATAIRAYVSRKKEGKWR